MSLHDPLPQSRPAPDKVMDLRGLNPAPVTAFKTNGEVDWDANARLAKWLIAKEGVKSLVILGHAGAVFNQNVRAINDLVTRNFASTIVHDRQ